MVTNAKIFLNFDVSYSMTVTRIGLLFHAAPYSPSSYDHRQHLFCFVFLFVGFFFPFWCVCYNLILFSQMWLAGYMPSVSV